MIIGVDLDSVLADIMPELIIYHNTEYKTNFTIEDYITFDWTQVWHVSFDEMLQRWTKFAESSQFEKVKPMEGSREVIKNLSKHHQLYVITSRAQEIHRTTRNWIEKHFGNSFEDIKFTNQYGKTKGQKLTKSGICQNLGVSLMIEDHMEFALDCASKNIDVLLLEQPWNQKEKLPKKIKRMRSWKEIDKYIYPPSLKLRRARQVA